jgi:hypothetical protein
VFDCFRDHRHGKGPRSLSVHGTANRMRCFTCDKRSLSPIDLVMRVRGCDVASAIQWIAEKFPGIPTRQMHLSRKGRSYKSNRVKPLTLQNRMTTPGWAARSPSAAKVITAIFARTPEAGSEQACLRCR